MNMPFSLICALSLLLISPLAAAGGDSDPAVEKKIVVALSTDDFELSETDISHLGVGDAKTIHTEDGKTIDLLRTEDGVEIYIDGELVDTGSAADGEPGAVHRQIRIICDGDDAENDCEELTWIQENDSDLKVVGEEGEHVIVIREHDGEGSHTVTIDEDVEHHADGEAHKIIVIRKSTEEI